MPVIARFYGLVIKMYFQGSEHGIPHFHVIYGEFSGVLDVQTLQMLEGDLPGKALAMAQEWAERNQSELLEIWKTQQFRQLPPLV